MLKYVFENDFDISVYDSKEEALKNSEYHWGMLSENEKQKLSYFKVYEIKADNIEQIDETSDLIDLMTEMIKNYLQ